MRHDTAASIAELVAEVRASMRLRDGYYLREELVDLYLVGVLRGMEAGLLEAESAVTASPDPGRRRQIDELAHASAELLRSLTWLRPAKP